MSWLFKTLSSDDHGVSSSSPAAKDDLSAIGHTIGRQLRGVAAFLAPPPLTESKLAAESSPSDSESNSEALLGLRSDLAEIGGSLKTGLTVLSSNGNKAVGEISRLASNFLPFPRKSEGEEYDDDDEEEEEEDFDSYGYGGEDYVPGITDDVLQFVTDISDRSECWTNFPLGLNHGFSMSDAQREHATTIEQYISDFAALRERLCTSMNEQVFWMIYFILLVPRLSGRDSELLSTPEIVKARDALLQMLRNKEAESETPENSTPTDTSQAQIPVGEIQTLDQNFPKLRVSDEANAEQRSLDKPIDESGNSSAADVRFETEDDISFSDLEDDDREMSRRSTANKGSGSAPSNDWVQLNESGHRKKDSEGEDSSGWLNVDGFD